MVQGRTSRRRYASIIITFHVGRNHFAALPRRRHHNHAVVCRWSGELYANPRSRREARHLQGALSVASGIGVAEKNFAARLFALGGNHGISAATAVPSVAEVTLSSAMAGGR